MTTTNEIHALPVSDNPAETFAVGSYLADEMQARGWSAEELARRSRLPLPTITGIIDGAVLIIPSMSAKLAAAMGTSEGLWLRLDHAHRVAVRGRASP